MNLFHWILFFFFSTSFTNTNTNNTNTSTVLGTHNRFKEMILVSQAADVQLDFMRRICPEFTARQMLQELVIFLSEKFDEKDINGNRCYVTLDIPILMGERTKMLRICSNEDGGKFL